MKTTQGKVLTAYTALMRIRGKVRGKDALDLFHLKNQLQEFIDFQGEEEMKIVEEHGGQVTPEGAVLIADEEKRKAFQKAMVDLRGMEVEVKADIPTLNLERNPDITMEDIEQLVDFVNFK